MAFIIMVPERKSFRGSIQRKLSAIILVLSIAASGCVLDYELKESESTDDSDAEIFGNQHTDTTTLTDIEQDSSGDSDSENDTETDVEYGHDSETTVEVNSNTETETDTQIEIEETDSGTDLEPEDDTTACADNLDNDGDSLKDCADPDCVGTPSCECLNGTTDKEPCGVLCGQAEKTCVEGSWGPLGSCRQQGVCEPMSEVEEDCGSCQVQRKVCRQDCAWGPWSACEPVDGCDMCDGSTYDGLCWYLGSKGQSCQDVCGAHGGYSPETVNYVGTAAQGGSRENCAALFEALGYDHSASFGYRTDGLGIGCHILKDEHYMWLESPDFNPTHSRSSAQLVCACKK